MHTVRSSHEPDLWDRITATTWAKRIAKLGGALCLVIGSLGGLPALIPNAEAPPTFRENVNIDMEVNVGCNVAVDRDRDEHGYPRPHGQRQRILNEYWPWRDSKGQPHARGIPDQPNPIPVHVRVVWEGGGEEWIDGMASRWTANAVFVAVDDERRRTIGVWVRPEDVRRR